MTYYAGFLAPVPKANRQAYVEHARKAWPMFRKHGAVRMVETWAEDVPHGKRTDFYRAVQCKDDEVPLFSWIEWPDKQTSDAAWAKMMQEDPSNSAMGEMPFDGRRMFWGGFTPVFVEGRSEPGRYVQGFVLAAQGDKRQEYVEAARWSWPMFSRRGATFTAENWGDDVPHGKVTDFYRATEATEGEVPVFSWIEWPDRATCDAAARAMESEMEAQGQAGMPEMPFDGKRMFWGGFVPVYDSARG